MTKNILGIIILFCFAIHFLQAQKTFTKSDSIRGRITLERVWWDLLKYDLNIEVFPKTKSIIGRNTITYKILRPEKTIQLELQAPLHIDSIIQNGKKLAFQNVEFSYFIELTEAQNVGHDASITVHYHGKPKEAALPPWEGGFIWSEDGEKNHFIATANQRIGSSVWFPCKDHPADEPESMEITVTCPDPLINVSNGRRTKIQKNKNGTTSYSWKVVNPINDYGISLNIARYIHFNETYRGLKGDLDCDYYVLSENLTKAKLHFKDVPNMLRAFEYWLGPYPFYEDGYKLVETPYLGMEHQSCIAYGNQYLKGYLGMKIGTSNWSMLFDYIIIHESAHEWFANSITCKDVADLWIHEAFASYAESLFIDFHYGKDAASTYVQGLRFQVRNDFPIVGKYDVRDQGSLDMYLKGSLMLHTLRQIVNDDEQWRILLIDLNKTFYHKTVTGREIISFICEKTKVNTAFFDQYLTTTKIPVLILKEKDNSIFYRWKNVLENFDIPLKIYIDGKTQWIHPKEKSWKKMKGNLNQLSVDANFYINLEKMSKNE